MHIHRSILVVVSLLIGCAAASPSPAGAPPSPPSPPGAPPGATCGIPAGHALIDNPPGWSESQECREGRMVWSNVPTADLSCERDSDCALFNDHCFVQVLNRRASTSQRYAARTCGSPLSGQCPQVDRDVRCVSGCCTALEKW